MGVGGRPVPGGPARESGVIEELRDLYAYDRWATDRILDAAERLTPEQRTRDLGSSHPSVLATLAHLASADWVWLERWRGVSPTGIPDDWDVSTLAGVRERWESVLDERRRFVEGLTEADLGREVGYRTTAGVPHRDPLDRLLRHVVNHATYHRGQVVTMLRQLGAEPPSTDLVLYYRDGEAARS